MRDETRDVLTEIALLFPGQGSQSVGMGRALASSSKAAASVFRIAGEVLGEDISRLAWEGPADELDRTENAQPALLTTSIAYLRALEEALARDGHSLPRPRFYAGHSMGQYSAMVAAGVLDLADAVRLVRERGKQMQASARDGAMAAVIGLDEARIPELEVAGRAAGVLTIANRNSPGQIVVSGERAAVEAAAEAAKSLGAKRAIVLPVSVAAHSPLMERAAEGMRAVLSSVPFQDPAAPLLANADARPLTTGEDCRAELIDHLTRGVDWVRIGLSLEAAGVEVALEVGPGKVLTGLTKRIAPGIQVLALDDPSAPTGMTMPSFDASPDPTPVNA